jgi:hypothetical protein
MAQIGAVLRQESESVYFGQSVDPLRCGLASEAYVFVDATGAEIAYVRFA